MESDPLLERFAAARPQELASLLADAEIHEVCELLRQLPEAIAAGLAAHLPSRQLSRALKELSPAEIGSLLVSATHEDAIAIVSLLSEARYSGILQAAPAAKRRVLRRLFELPSHSLGALASPDYIRANVDMRCDAFLEHLRAHEESSQQPIYAVDELGIFKGEINPLSVISRQNQKARLADIVVHLAPLSGELSAAAALKSRLWARHQQLPVVDSRGHLLGSVHRQTLLKHAPKSRTEIVGLESILTEIAMSYLEFCERVLRMLFAGKSQ
jgi:Mg/Co/Ni transporter MgtE